MSVRDLYTKSTKPVWKAYAIDTYIGGGGRFGPFNRKLILDMSSEPPPEPDQPRPVIYIGQDRAGHWLVQDSAKRLEGRFVSYAAARTYAEAERQMYRAELRVAPAPLVPMVSFAPIAADEYARAA